MWGKANNYFHRHISNLLYRNQLKKWHTYSVVGNGKYLIVHRLLTKCKWTHRTTLNRFNKVAIENIVESLQILFPFYPFRALFPLNFIICVFFIIIISVQLVFDWLWNNTPFSPERFYDIYFPTYPLLILSYGFGGWKNGK